MSPPVVIIGLGAEGLTGLTPSALDEVRNATFPAGGRRQLRLAEPSMAEPFAIVDNIDALLERLARRGPEERCVVLATGDPLFYGIGHRLVEALGPDQVRVVPALSSMQLAFARIPLSWHDAAIASVHGRPLNQTLLPLLGRPKIGLFTRDGDSPSEVSRFFLERGLPDYDAWVCENLNAPEEAIFPSALADLPGRRFAALNILILRRNPVEGSRVLEELTDDAFARPDTGAVLLTHEDVRALVLRRFRGLGDGPIWDIGAGLGGVSVELARGFPGREIVAVERSAAQVEFLRVNRAKFGAYNLRIVAGEAPDCLLDEEPPAGIFLGGSGGKLDAILNLVFNRLSPGGRLVANFVGLENLASVLERLKALGWNVDLAEVQVSQGRPLAGLTTFVPRRPVWIVRADCPEE
jgi:precorrin-6B C5,15-methyltransferase / cobalt-precorrin-6B C5,C15-methyltransferase